MFKHFLIFLIQCYQWVLSPYVGHNCRFHPTCSNYAIKALQKYGTLQGLVFTFKRISKCHPWHSGGHDPLP